MRYTVHILYLYILLDFILYIIDCEDMSRIYPQYLDPVQMATPLVFHRNF